MSMRGIAHCLAAGLLAVIVLTGRQQTVGNVPADLRDAPISDSPVSQLDSAAAADGVEGLQIGTGIPAPSAAGPAAPASGCIPKRRKVDLRYLFADAPYGPRSSKSVSDKDADLQGLFLDGDREQGRVGSCHSFAATAVLEAAYARKYGRTIRFSEADLFLRRMVIGNSAISDRLLTGGDIPQYLEGGDIIRDVGFALRTGMSVTPSYENFLAKYNRLRAEPKTVVSELLPSLPAGCGAFQPGGADPDCARMLDAALYGYFGLDDGSVNPNRREIREAFKGFEVRARRFPLMAAGQLLAPAAGDVCRRKAAGITAAITRELDAGRPVGVCLYWEKPSLNSGHCVTFTGYETGADSALSFLVRNSWGGYGKAGISDSELCRVIEFVSVVP